jgi:hypothetical protein
MPYTNAIVGIFWGNPVKLYFKTKTPDFPAFDESAENLGILSFREFIQRIKDHHYDLIIRGEASARPSEKGTRLITKTLEDSKCSQISEKMDTWWCPKAIN